MLTKDQALELCDSFEIYENFFDEESEEYLMMKDHNPLLLSAYEELYRMAIDD